jgi:hypothetical protein
MAAHSDECVRISVENAPQPAMVETQMAIESFPAIIEDGMPATREFRISQGGNRCRVVLPGDNDTWFQSH